MALRYGLRYQSSGFWVVVGSMILVLALFGSFRYLQKAAEPTYGPAPDFPLVEGGADLAKASPGLSTMKDVFWASAIVLVLLGLSDYAWILVIAGIVYVAVLGYTYYIKPMIGGMGASSTGHNSDSQQQRAAQRSQRRKIKRAG